MKPIAIDAHRKRDSWEHERNDSIINIHNESH